MPWLFGYGSIVWRPNLEYVRKRPALLKGWGRSFNQKSFDHRGTPEAPGRVLTLRQDPNRACLGMAFEINNAAWGDTLLYLDHREKGGYERTLVEIEMEGQTVCAVSYIAPPGNPHDAGKESVEHIVQVIHRAHGPSGSNQEYLLALMHALAQCEIKDPYLDEVLAAFHRFDHSLGSQE